MPLDFGLFGSGGYLASAKAELGPWRSQRRTDPHQVYRQSPFHFLAGF